MNSRKAGQFDFKVPQAFENLLESEMRRRRRDGLTTRLAGLAREMGYKFVVANRQHQHLVGQDGFESITPNQDFRGMSTGFVWDHFAVHMACGQMLRVFENLKEQHSQDAQAIRQLEKSWYQSNKERAEFERKVQAAEELIGKLEAVLISAKRTEAYWMEGETAVNIFTEEVNAALELIRAYKEKK